MLFFCCFAFRFFANPGLQAAASAAELPRLDVSMIRWMAAISSIFLRFHEILWISQISGREGLTPCVWPCLRPFADEVLPLQKPLLDIRSLLGCWLGWLAAGWRGPGHQISKISKDFRCFLMIA